MGSKGFLLRSGKNILSALVVLVVIYLCVQFTIAISHRHEQEFILVLLPFLSLVLVIYLIGMLFRSTLETIYKGLSDKVKIYLSVSRWLV